MKKPWKELQPRSRKNISDEYVFIIKQLCWYGIYYKKISFIMYLVRTVLIFFFILLITQAGSWNLVKTTVMAWDY